jgi:hypothetical protein
MAKKMTVNIRGNLAAPYGFEKEEDDLDKLVKKYFNKRGNVNVQSPGKKYVITSYTFRNGTNAEIKIRVTYSNDGYIRAFDMLGTFDVYKRYIIDSIDQYRKILLGFIAYLNKIVYGWFVDVFVFRIHPVDFMCQYTSRVGDMINSVHLILRLDGSDYCIIKGDRLEYRCSEWQSNAITTVMTLVNKYTRK